jgi:hypothetical protein
MASTEEKPANGKPKHVKKAGVEAALIEIT